MSPWLKLTIAACVVAAFVAGRYWPHPPQPITQPHSEPVTQSHPQPNHPAPAPTVQASPADPTGPVAPIDSLYDRFRLHLDQGEWPAAVAVYEGVYSRFDEAASTRFRAHLLDTASTALNPSPRLSVALLSAYTEIFFQDGAALELLAEGQVRVGETEPALRSLHDAYLAAYLPEDQARIQERIDTLVAQHAQQLEAAKKFSGLVTFYGSLLDQRPGYAPYYMRLAEAHMHDGNEAGARRALRYIQYDPELGDQARRQLARLDDAAPAPSQRPSLSVPMTRVGNNFVVPVLVNSVPLRLLLDTGASLTVLRPASASRVGTEIHAAAAISLETANGRLRAPLGLIRHLNIGGARLSELRVAIVDLGALDEVDGLLGMDVLSRYRVTIDRQQARLYLSR